MPTPFIGKITLGQGANVVQIDMTSGALSLGPQPADGSDRFNAYGTASAFVLQGANGLYVVAAGDGYAATAVHTAAMNQYTLSVPDGAGTVTDLGTGGTGTSYYWNSTGTTLGRIAIGATPPASTIFDNATVTPGVAAILQQGFLQANPDLTWVTLSGTDFTRSMTPLDFTAATLTHADLSNCRFSPGVMFDRSVAPHANFSGATLKNCSMGSVDCTQADFTGAQMAGITLDYSDFTDAVMNQAMLTRSLNLASAKFIRTKLQGADFTGSANIYQTDFTGADLTGAIFTGSSVTGTMTIVGANLTGAALNNSATKVTIYPKMIVLDSTTNLTGAQLQYIDFSDYSFAATILTDADMTGCKFQRCDFSNAELSYATLDGGVFTGTVKLNGANLSNASLRGADMTNAQLGALSDIFSVGSATPDYTPFLTALRAGDAAGVKTIFANNGHPIAGTITITASRFSATVWTVEATAPTLTDYTVIQETIGGVMALDVYVPTTPAVLSNAFMVNVNLTGANMIGVNAAGASIYGTGGVKPNLNSALLQEAQFDNGNLGNADFSSANLAGVTFDYAVLTNAVFQNVTLTTAAGGSRPSFVGANIQGANFDGATVSNTVFTNAAVGAANPNVTGTPQAAGVWLFSIAPQQQLLVTSELSAAGVSTPPSTSPKHQFTLSLQSLQQLQTPGPVGKGIISGFAAAGITLTDAILTVTSDELYWQLTSGSTHYVIFRSFDTTAYQPALGVAAGTSYTPTPQFTLPLSLESALNNGPVDQAVIDAFAAANHPIQADSQIAVALHPTDWQVTNGAPDYQVYSLWLEVSGNTTVITGRPAIPNLLAAFYAASIALSPRATVVTLSAAKGGGWTVNNDSENPYNPVTSYIIFNLVPNAVTQGLDVYGAYMRIERLATPTTMQYFNIPAAITSIAQAQMASPGNVCPDGDFATTNLKNKVPFDQWLRARMPPRPPLCVPDPAGMYFCPR